MKICNDKAEKSINSIRNKTQAKTFNLRIFNF